MSHGGDPYTFDLCSRWGMPQSRHPSGVSSGPWPPCANSMEHRVPMSLWHESVLLPSRPACPHPLSPFYRVIPCRGVVTQGRVPSGCSPPRGCRTAQEPDAVCAGGVRGTRCEFVCTSSPSRGTAAQRTDHHGCDMDVILVTPRQEAGPDLFPLGMPRRHAWRGPLPSAMHRSAHSLLPGGSCTSAHLPPQVRYVQDHLRASDPVRTRPIPPCAATLACLGRLVSVLDAHSQLPERPSSTGHPLQGDVEPQEGRRRRAAGGAPPGGTGARAQGRQAPAPGRPRSRAGPIRPILLR